MTTYAYNSANTEGVNFNETWTVYDQTAAPSSTNDPANPGSRVAPGTTVKGTADSDFVCVQASAAITAGDVCLISATYTAAGITTTTAANFGALVGVAPVAIASGAYGYLQRAGTCSPTGIRVSTVANPYVQLSTTAVAGVLDDATTTALVKISDIILTITNSAATTAAVAGTLNYPVVGAAY